jgi:hypothetical protein
VKRIDLVALIEPKRRRFGRKVPSGDLQQRGQEIRRHTYVPVYREYDERLIPKRVTHPLKDLAYFSAYSLVLNKDNFLTRYLRARSAGLFLGIFFNRKLYEASSL